MRANFRFGAAALAAVVALIAPLAAYPAVEQVADIQPETGAPAGSMSPPYIIRADNGETFFVAETATDRKQLWASDGTAAGTYRLTDVAGGLDTSTLSMTYLGGELYFADRMETGSAIWKSDGTPAGTQPVFEPVPGPSGETIVGLKAVNGTLYFGLNNNGQFSIWTSDGTAAGTDQIKALGPELWIDPSYYHFAAAGGKAIFTRADGSGGLELWATDGSAIGTTELHDFAPIGGNKRLAEFTALPGGKTLFTHAGYELWVTDGAATSQVAITDGTKTGAYPFNLTLVGDKIYFAASGADGTTDLGETLWSADGGPTAQFIDFSATGSNKVDKESLTAAGSNLYFANYANTMLIKWDGTAGTAGTALDLTAGEGYLRFPVSSDGNLYFRLSGGSKASGLYRYDGGSAYELLAPIAFDGYATAAYDGKLFLAADDGAHGIEPWLSDGTAAGTRMIKNIARSGSHAGSDPNGLTVAGGKLYFLACDTTHGCEPRVSDGTSSGTRLLADINPGGGDSYAGGFIALGNAVYFAAYNGSANLLWKTAGDGATSVTSGGSFDDPESLVAVNGELYFSAWTSATSYRLWKSDGTAAGTAMVGDPAVMPIVSGPVIAAGDKLFLTSHDPGGSTRLWVSDGTATGTQPVTSPTVAPDHLYQSAVVGGDLYFLANDGTHGDELWITDGTPAGTHMVKDIAAGTGGSDAWDLTVYQGRVYFFAFTAKAGYELWRTDGTAAGTELFADLNPGAASSDPDGLTVAGGKLYFAAWRSGAGYELWATDGGEPVLVKDIRPGARSSAPDLLTAIGNRIVFRANSGVNGYEPWISDGTTAGTHIIGDINAGADSSRPVAFILFKRQLFFAANDGQTGAELWRADINRAPEASSASITTAFETAVSGKLAATDPDSDALTFSIAKQPAHGKVELTDIATGAFTYAPADGYSGKDGFTFNADDGLAGSTAALKITVQSSDDGGDAPPPASSDGGGSGGGGGWGLLGGLLMLGALSRKRKVNHR